MAVVAFGSNDRVICSFTIDPEKVREAVAALFPEGATRYLDAVAEALEVLHQETGCRAVLAPTDGEDTFSQSATIDSVIVAARRLGLPVDTLGLGSEDENESEALKRLAAQTQGQYYPARQADQLRMISEQIAERPRSTSARTYQTDRRLPDGTLRPVRISYRASRQAGEIAVYIPEMVVPAAGWSRLFLALVVVLATLRRVAWAARAGPHRPGTCDISAAIRRRVAGSRIGRPSVSRETNPWPARRRRMPGRRSETWRSPAACADATGTA